MKTIYILGAGASFPYGYPTGTQLIDQILNIRVHGINVLRHLQNYPLDNFLDALRASKTPSIDL